MKQNTKSDNDAELYQNDVNDPDMLLTMIMITERLCLINYRVDTINEKLDGIG